MTSPERFALLALFLAALLFPLHSPRAEAPMATEPEECVFLGFPNRLAYLQEDNLLVMVNGGGVYAFDVASGGQRWHRFLSSTNGFQGAFLGKRQVLGWSDQGLFLLDVATGRETWWRRDNRCGRLEGACLSPDETLVLAAYEQGCILYTVADRTQRILPHLPKAWVCGLLSGNKTLLFEQWTKNADGDVRKWLLMDADSGAVIEGPERAVSPEAANPTLSSLGQFAEAAAEEGDSTALTIWDARTGAALRAFKGIPGRSKRFLWFRDGKRLFSLTSDKKQARVVDAETGAVQFSLSREGHQFLVQATFEDDSDRAWCFSQDDANNRYAWALTPDGAPQKVLDGARLGPGYFELHVADQCYALASRVVAGPVWAQTLYTLEGLLKVAEWRFHVPKGGAGHIINQAMTHYLDLYDAVKDDQRRPQNMAFSLYVQDHETPVRTGKGSPIALSPDAKYMVVQTDETTSCLYDAEKDRILCQYVSPPREYNYGRMTAAFSDNGKRLVVNTTESIEVSDLTEGYARRSMATGGDRGIGWAQPLLSADGTRVLVGGYNRAWLFDAGTGALLHNFEETERFAALYLHSSGFWNSLAATAEDWAGMVTDRFNPGSSVEVAFADGGARVITHAAGQLIRVWDAGSGRQLQTIHTGLPEKRNKNGQIRNKIILSTAGSYAFCRNEDDFGPASLWSLADGVLVRRYQLPESAWRQVAPNDDGTAVYIRSNDNLYRWPGVSKDPN